MDPRSLILAAVLGLLCAPRTSAAAETAPAPAADQTGRIVVFAAGSIAALIEPAEPPGFALQVIEDGPGLDLTQRFKNKARSFCSGPHDGKGSGQVMLLDLGPTDWRVAGPLPVRCDAPPASADGVDFALFGIDAALINQSAAQWQVLLHRLPAQISPKARLGYLFTEAYYQAQRETDPVMAKSRCPELSFAGLPGADSDSSWLAGFSYHLCSAGNGQILGAALDLAIFGRFGFQEVLRANLERLHFSDGDKRRLVRFLLRRAARGPDAAEPRLDIHYFQADRPGSSCSVEAVTALDPTSPGLSLGVDLVLTCSLSLGTGGSEHRVSSSLRFGEARKLSFRRYNFRAPNKARARYIKAIRDGLLQSISEDGKALGLIVFFNESDEPGFTLDNEQDARVLGVDILSVDQVTVAGAALEYRPRRAEAPCVLAPRQLAFAAISYDNACELRLLSNNGFSYRIYSVSRAADDLSCEEEQRLVAPESGTSCRIANVQCPDLSGAHFVINIEAAKNLLVPVCSEGATN